MHKYTHHIGDYAQATAHLSFIEDAAYSRLIRKYYADERPLPCDIPKLQRIVGARTKEEKKAVVDVLSEFFYEKNNFYHHKRCDEEIEKFLEFNEDSENKKANEKERQRRHREERKRLFNQLFELDIVPPFDIKTEALRSILSDALSRVTNKYDTSTQHVNTEPVTADATANHYPLPITHISINPQSTPDEFSSFRMFPSWQPSAHLDTVAAVTGAPGITKQEGYLENLGEFITYWLSKNESKTQGEWDHALIRSIKHTKLNGYKKKPASEFKQPAKDEPRKKKYESGLI